MRAATSLRLLLLPATLLAVAFGYQPQASHGAGVDRALRPVAMPRRAHGLDPVAELGRRAPLQVASLLQPATPATIRR